MDPEMKHCSHCGETKPLDAFYRNAHRAGGRDYYCAACRRAASAVTRRAVRKQRQAATKVCCRCRKEKPLGEFSVNRDRKDGLNGSCRVCESRRQRAMKRQTDAIYGCWGALPGRVGSPVYHAEVIRRRDIIRRKNQVLTAASSERSA